MSTTSSFLQGTRNVNVGTVKNSGAILPQNDYFIHFKSLNINGKAVDDVNVQRFKEKMKMAADEMRFQTINSEVGKDKGLLKERSEEMTTNNTKVANFFLGLIQDFVWRKIGIKGDGTFKEDSYISGVSIDEAITKLEPVILSYNKVLQELLDIKYNTNLAGALINKSIEDRKSDALFKNNPFHKFSKKN